MDGVDVVFEIHNFKPAIPFSTDEYSPKGSQEKIKLQKGKFIINGVGMKVILRMADSGDKAGEYGYVMIPCLEGCEYNVGEGEFVYRDKNTKRTESTVNGLIQTDVVLNFVKESTRDVTKRLKKIADDRPKKKSFGLIISSKKIYEIDKVENNKIQFSQNGVQRILDQDKVSLVDVRYVDDVLQIIDLKKKTPLLTLEKGDKVIFFCYIEQNEL